MSVYLLGLAWLCLVEQNQAKFQSILEWLKCLTGNSWMSFWGVSCWVLKSLSKCEWLCQSGLLILKGPKNWTSSCRASCSTDKMEICLLKYQESELGYTYQWGPDKESALKAAARVGKTRESMLLGMDILPLAPNTCSCSRHLSRSKEFPSCGRGSWCRHTAMMAGATKECWFPHPASGSGQERLEKHVSEDKHAVMSSWLWALFELQCFLSQKQHLCVLHPSMGSSSVDFSDCFWSHVNF